VTLVAAPPPPPAWRNWLWLLLIAAIFASFYLLPTGSPSTSLTYTQFVHNVQAHQVKTIELASSPSGTSSGTLANGTDYTVVIPPQAGQSFLTGLQKAACRCPPPTPRRASALRC
jgi:cell division protease FtsH